MNIQIFGRSKCFDTKKAERWFKERRIRFQAIDLKKQGMSLGELTSVKNAVGLEAMVDPKHPDAGQAGEALRGPLPPADSHRPQRAPGRRGLLPRGVGGVDVGGGKEPPRPKGALERSPRLSV